jgi:L-aminopeptidase/D-esterase-like protein
MNNTLTALNGVQVGHSTHLDKLTGCTFVLFDESYPTAYRSYGGAVGSFNTECLRVGKMDYGQRGLFIAGGSLTGLMSASEIMQAMIEDGVGDKDAAHLINPGISGAIVMDQGTRVARYDPKYGREAYQNLNREPVANGNVGAGTGTAVGKFQWLEKGTKSGGMKAGVGSARIDLGNGIMVCALSVVNALGNVVLPDGTILAGNRDVDKAFKTYEDLTDFVTQDKTNTTITIVGTNVDLGSHDHYDNLAHHASLGQARAIYPVNLSQDGDTVFVFSNKQIKKPLNEMGKLFSDTPDGMHFVVDILGHAAARAVQESIYSACREAESVSFDDAYEGVLPSCKDYPRR